jgi:hypothetical protein
LNLSKSFRLKLAKLAKIPENRVDHYLRRSLRYLRSNFSVDQLPLIAAKMKQLYKLDLKSSKKAN